MVKDIRPGSAGSGYGSYAAVAAGDLLYFSAEDGVHGPELWVTDGAEASTRLVADIYPGAIGSGVGYSDLVVIEDTVFFAADDSVHGQELWSSDGTLAGTRLVADIVPGSGGSNPGTFFGMVVADNTVYFAANDGVHGVEIWASDGAGARLVADIWPGTGWSLFGESNLVAMNGQLFLTADDNVHGRELWTSDGTEAGTRIVKDVRPGSMGSVLVTSRLAVSDDMVYLWLDDGVHGNELWASDGTNAGTRLVKDIRPGLGVMMLFWPELVGMGDSLFFTTDDSMTGVELWLSDGTDAGTYLIKDVRTDNEGSHRPNPGGAVANGGVLFFPANDSRHGNELWRSDGSEPGTSMVVDILPDSDGAIPLYNSSNVVSIGDDVFFPADDGLHGLELWTSSSVTGETHLVADIYPGPRSAYLSRLFAIGQTLYFAADDGVHGYEIWASDGTTQGTRLISDIWPGSSSSLLGSPHFKLVAAGATVYFVADDGIHGYELWASDGTEAGTRMVKDIMPGPGDSIFIPRPLSTMGGKAYFSANDGVHGEELWVSDGTEAGTHLVADVNAGPASAVAWVMNVAGRTLFFAADDGIHGWELWASDGTRAGTHLVADIMPGSGSSGVSASAVASNRFYFYANDGIHGSELWTSLGTAATTRMVKDIRPGPAGSDSNYFDLGGTSFGNWLFFWADDGVHGRELWVTNGAAAGTMLVGDIHPGSAGSAEEYGHDPITADGNLYFFADDGVHGTELWALPLPRMTLRGYLPLLTKNTAAAPMPTSTPAPTPTIVPTPIVRFVHIYPSIAMPGDVIQLTSGNWTPETSVSVSLVEAGQPYTQAYAVPRTTVTTPANPAEAFTIRFDFPDDPRWQIPSDVWVYIHNASWTEWVAARWSLENPHACERLGEHHVSYSYSSSYSFRELLYLSERVRG